VKNRFLFVSAFLSIFLAAAHPQSRYSSFFVLNETFDNSFDFETTGSWQGNAEVVDAQTEIKNKDLQYFENDTKFIKLNAAAKGTTELTLPEISVPVDSALSFRYRTEIIGRAGQTFKVYIDGSEKASFEGVDGSWLRGTLPLAAGQHSIKFEVQNARGSFVTNGYNSVYLDDIRIVHDTAVELLLFPQGNQDTYAGADGLHRIQFKTKTLRADGSERNGNEQVVLSASGGTLDGDGFWTPPGEGTFTVTASLGDITVVSGTITVHQADYLKKPFTYAGTGKTYMGYTGRRDSAPPIEVREDLRVTSPEYTAFDADGFFLLEGSINKPRSQNHARVVVTKIAGGGATGTGRSRTPKLETWYIIKDDFSQRIWLPFGAGEYKIEIFVFDSISLTRPPNGEGTFRSGSYRDEPLELTVFNTRDENYVDGDARWIYPSFYVQSDDFLVTNLLNSITFGKTGAAEKTRAVHDYIVSTLVYDNASFRNIARSRKMDAVSVIENGTGVCEGYANLSAALLRAAGIPVKIVATRSISHAWNNVYIDGAWNFYDATGDDPVPDRGPGIIGYTYFLLDSLTGGDNRHRGAGTPLIGDAE
jgi:transglutaminase-like putative cysteine protease